MKEPSWHSSFILHPSSFTSAANEFSWSTITLMVFFTPPPVSTSVARFELPAVGPVDWGAVPFPSDLYRNDAGAIRIGARCRSPRAERTPPRRPERAQTSARRPAARTPTSSNAAPARCASNSTLAGRARQLSGLDLPFEEVRQLRRRLDGCVIDVILTVMTLAIGRWFAAHRLDTVEELMTLVPINLRKADEWGISAQTGNVASGVLVPLPIRLRDPLATYQEVRARMAARKADPAAMASPVLAEALSGLPRALVSWLAETTFGSIDFIVTNVPGIPVPRYLAGSEILAAYPFAPVALKSPVSVALYSYRDRLFIGLDSDRNLMPDVGLFQRAIVEAFGQLSRAAGPRPPRRAAPRRAARAGG